MVQRMTVAQGMGPKGEGYSYDYCKRVLNKSRRNDRITELHRQLVKLRTPQRNRK